MDVSTKPLVKLDLGAGDKTNEGYVRVGLQNDHDVICDLRCIPLPDDYADEAQAIHVLEHFYPWDVPAVLQEWCRLLKPGGLLVLELPDLLKCCRNVLHDANPRNGILGLYGDGIHEDALMLHKWGYSPAAVKTLLRAAGFVKVKERDPQYHGKRAHRDMRVEARKPQA